MASRSIHDLSPRMQVLYDAFQHACANDPALAGVEVLVTCTWRSQLEQAALYAQGRDPAHPGPILTNAKPGLSKHNTTTAEGAPSAEAFDVVPVVHGKCDWGTTGDDLKLWQRIGQHGIDVGLKWYGTPGSPFKEFPHFQNPEA